jgi:hypothetical protein
MSWQNGSLANPAESLTVKQPDVHLCCPDGLGMGAVLIGGLRLARDVIGVGRLANSALFIRFHP